jgi:perosamine synthetase
MQFVVPKEPLLHWSMFWPVLRGQAALSSLSGRPVYYVFWARNAIYHGLKTLRISPGESVLVPAFHCASAVEPILQYGARVIFYNIHRNCLPDLDDLQAKIDKTTRAVLAIHYFGFPQPVRELQEFCRDHHLYLIEECAHVLTGQTDAGALGAFGDISIFSWRKFLPLYDGGHLVVNNPELHADIPRERGGLLFTLKVAKNTFSRLLDDSAPQALRFVSHLCDLSSLTFRRLLLAERFQPKALTINNYSGDFDLSTVNLEMSGFSQYILRRLDLPGIIEKRRQNYTVLLKAVKSLPELTPFSTHLPAGVCPWVFPILVKGRQDFHVTLRSRGIPAFTWGGVIHPTLPLAEFPDAAFLYQNLILLPIHQSLDATKIRVMVDIIAQTLRHYGN